jgi:membrane fusion protein (multidrug efflux system)
MNPAPHDPTDSPPSSPARSVHLGRWAFAAVLLIGVAWYVGAAPRTRSRKATEHRAEQAGTPFVLVTRASSTNASESPTFPAEIKAWSEAQILPRATGYIRRWNVDLGARVKAGELLAEIEAPELEQELAQARANLDHAVAATALARTSATRWQALLLTAGVSEQETAEKVADVALKQAAEASAQAAVRRLEQLLGFTRITAPFAGTITVRRVEIGHLVSAGSPTELFHLADTSRVRVFVHLPQSLAATLVPDQAAELLPGDSNPRRIPVHVARTGGQLEAATRTLLVEFNVDNADGSLLAGGFTRVRFPDSRPEPVLTLPANCVLFRPEGPQVGLVGENGQVELRRVDLGRDLGPVIEIRSGLNGSERVILNPTDSLHNGQAVQVRETSATPKP